MEWSVFRGTSDSLRVHNLKNVCVCPTKMCGCSERNASTLAATLSKLNLDTRWLTPPMYAMPNFFRFFATWVPLRISSASSRTIPLHLDMSRCFRFGHESTIPFSALIVKSQQPERSKCERLRPEHLKRGRTDRSVTFQSRS